MNLMTALALQVGWGADEAIDPGPHNRVLPSPVPAAPSIAPAGHPTAPTPALVSLARRLAEQAGTLTELRDALAGFEACSLSATAKLVFGEGDPTAGLVLIGEAPGAEEDVAGRPFVGPSGQLLDRMLASVGIDRSRCWITNLIPWRPPGNRPPTDDEVEACLPFLTRSLVLQRPHTVVTLGNLPTRALTGSQSGIRRLRGRWQTVVFEGGVTVRVLPMFHPSYLLRMPSAKRDAWQDLVALRRALDSR